MNELVVQFVITLPSNLEFEMSFDADISISHRNQSVVPFDVAGFTHFVQKDSLEIIIFGADIAGKAVAQLLKKWARNQLLYRQQQKQMFYGDRWKKRTTLIQIVGFE